MYERKEEPLATGAEFAKRLTRNLLLAFGILVFSFFLGTMGYHFLNDLCWVDAFYNTCMILTGMGPADVMKNDAAKIFASCYALYSGMAFLTSFAVVIAPVLHRAMHKFHFNTED